MKFLTNAESLEKVDFSELCGMNAVWLEDVMLDDTEYSLYYCPHGSLTRKWIAEANAKGIDVIRVTFGDEYVSI